MADLPRIAVLVSGEGTNLQALIDRLHGDVLDIACVATDKPGARGCQRADAAGIPTRTFPLSAYEDRDARDTDIADWLREARVGTVVLAGYMALLTGGFVSTFRDRIINVHPSLLPEFPGMRAVQEAVDAGVDRTGVTVHLVDEGVDTGPVLLQRAVDVPPGTDVPTLRELLAPIEHDLLCEAVAGLARTAPVRPHAG